MSTRAVGLASEDDLELVRGDMVGRRRGAGGGRKDI